MRRIAALLLAGLALATTASAATAAAKQAVFGLRAVGNPARGYFVYALAPGAGTSGAVIVSNVGTATGTVKLYTADGTTGATTGTVYKTNSAPTGAGSWVKLAASSFSLAPGAHRQVSFTVHVPAGAKPGQWVGGIVAEASHRVSTQKSGQKAKVQITIRNQTIVAVQVNVPGKAVNAFTVGDVTTGGSKGYQKVIVHIANIGNVLASPHGTVTIYKKDGTPIQTLPFTMDTFLPQTAIDYPLLLKKALGAGDYLAGIRLVSPATAGAPAKVVTAKPAFSVSNEDVKQVFSSSQPTQTTPGVTGTLTTSSNGAWVYVAAGAIVVLLLLLLLLLLRRRRKKPGAAPTTVVKLPPIEPEPEETAVPEPPAPAAAPTPEPSAPAAPAAPATCTPYHYWDVAYDRGVLGNDGVWRFPHRCRNCGLELLARDIEDASAQASAPPRA